MWIESGTSRTTGILHKQSTRDLRTPDVFRMTLSTGQPIDINMIIMAVHRNPADQQIKQGYIHEIQM